MRVCGRMWTCAHALWLHLDDSCQDESWSGFKMSEHVDLRQNPPPPPPHTHTPPGFILYLIWVIGKNSSRRLRGYVFTPLFVCKQDDAKPTGWITTRLCRRTSCESGKNPLSFRVDPAILFSTFSQFQECNLVQLEGPVGPWQSTECHSSYLIHSYVYKVGVKRSGRGRKEDWRGQVSILFDWSATPLLYLLPPLSLLSPGSERETRY